MQSESWWARDARACALAPVSAMIESTFRGLGILKESRKAEDSLMERSEFELDDFINSQQVCQR